MVSAKPLPAMAPLNLHDIVVQDAGLPEHGLRRG